MTPERIAELRDYAHSACDNCNGEFNAEVFRGHGCPECKDLPGLTPEPAWEATRKEYLALLDAWEDRERLREWLHEQRRRCLNHCPCAKLNGNVMGDFDPDKQPCACPIGECEVEGCECEVPNGR